MPIARTNIWRAPAILALLGLGAATRAEAGVPDWLQTASRDPMPQYTSGSVAVILRSEQVVTVKSAGEVTTVCRRAYRILRPEGRRYGVVRVYFDSETRITSIKGWSIPASGGTYELSEKDAVDSIGFTGNLYDDIRQKVLRIPAAEPGAVIGYEYEQRRRPSILQDSWEFQQEIPVLQARLQLRLPGGWEYRDHWANHPNVAAQSAGSGQFVWDLRDVQAIQEEPGMLDWQAVAGRVLLAYAAPNGGGSLKSWAAVGQWYGQLVAGRRQAGPELRQKVEELTAGISNPVAKMQALASFVQHGVRYVAIEIGIGGYQPHSADEVFKNRYGDCKDKATLLSAMLDQAGVESYYVLINTRRGVLIPTFPSALAFNHAVLAIRLLVDTSSETFQGNAQPAQMGPLLFFDPTDTEIPFGHLSADLQANYGLVVGSASGQLLKLPAQPASANVLLRNAKMRLAANGELTGQVRETRQGNRAFEFRAAWINASESDRRKIVQASFGRLTPDLSDISVKGLNEPEANLVLDFNFRLGHYASSAGGLLLMNPRVFGEWGDRTLETGERKHPVQFPVATVQTEISEITLPDGWTVDELPSPVDADIGTILYGGWTEIDGEVLRYTRRMALNDVLLKTEQLHDFKNFNRQITTGENGAAVLKRP